MIDKDTNLSLRHQCKLLSVNRSSYYYPDATIDKDSEIANLIDEIYLSSNCRYGYRKITHVLHNKGYQVNHKKVLRLMNEMGIEGRYPKKRISYNKSPHHIFPFLLSDIALERPNQAWSTDITYIKVDGSFTYFLAIIDIYSRYIIAYDLSVTMDALFCVECLKESLKKNKPVIFNSDQGVQFTSNDFISVLNDNDIKISMAHKGRCFDNIHIERLWRTLKQEVISFYKPENINQLQQYIEEFVQWYNNERIHQSLQYFTPKQVYNKEVTLNKK